MTDSVNQLEAFYRTIQPRDLLGKYALRRFDQKPVAAKDPVLEQVNNLLVHSGDRTGSGLLSFQEIVQGLVKTFTGHDTNELHTQIQIFHDSVLGLQGADRAYFNDSMSGNKPITMGSILSFPSNDERSKRFGVIMSSTPFVSLPVRDINKVVLFMNAVPTVELSRCSPLLDIQFQFRRGSENDTILRSPSLLKFLNGAISLKNGGSADNAMFRAAQDTEVEPGGKQKPIYMAGMELLTSPQVMFNPISIEGGNAKRFVPVLDAFRPFMSIDGFEVTAAPTVGMFSYKTAKLSLVLHDRSRLAEVSDFVRPEVYTNTTLSISYGWRHPDSINSDNVYGDLMNQMVMKNEKYGIVNASFVFDNAQQVKITLSLAMKGMSELRIVRISEDAEFSSNQQEVLRLQDDIRRLLERAGLRKPEFITKEIRPYQVLEEVSNGETVTELYKGELKAIISDLRRNKNTDVKQLASKLDALTAGDQGIAKLKSTIKSRLQEKWTKLESGPDPFLLRANDDKNPYKGEILAAQKERADGTKLNRFVSLAKLFLVFCVEPLLGSPTVDQVQLVFYQFNSQAGLARDTNIGAFPIEIKYLKEVFEDHIVQKRNVDMTINEFALLVQSAIVNDPRAVAYGLRSLYAERKVGKETENARGVTDKKIQDTFSQVMKDQGGSFKFPAVEAYVETRGGAALKNGERGQEKSSADIMRIHVFDKQATPYDQWLQLYRSQTGLQEIVEKTSADKNPNKETMRDLVNLVQSVGHSFQFFKDDRYGPKATGEVSVGFTDAAQLKELITTGIPTITYGTNNTAVMNATLQTQQNQLLSTVQMLRTAGRQNNTEPNGSSVGGIPLRIIPCQLDMTTFGCPLLNINQQFFIDFGTGTTADNVYLLTHLEHKIKQGQFESHARFTPLDSYGVLESIVSKVRQLSSILSNNSSKLTVGTTG